MPKNRGVYTEWQKKVEATRRSVGAALVIDAVSLGILYDAMEESCRSMGTALNDLQSGDRTEGLRYEVGDLLRYLGQMRRLTKIIGHRASELGGDDDGS